LRKRIDRWPRAEKVRNLEDFEDGLKPGTLT